MIFVETGDGCQSGARAKDFRTGAFRISLLTTCAALILLSATKTSRAACASGAICITQSTDSGDASVVGSYSWAIKQANAGGNQTIGFDPSAFVGPNPKLTLSGTSAQTPRLSASVTIDGSTVPNLTIDGSNQREILFIRPDAPDAANPISVTIRDVTLANGKAQGGAGGSGGYGGGGGMGSGGAIYVGKGVALTAENVSLSGNTAQGGQGGSTGNSQAGSGGGGLNGGVGANGAPTTNGIGGGGGGTGAGANADVTNGGGPAGGAGASATTPAQNGGDYSGGGAASWNTSGSAGGAGGWGGGGGGGGRKPTGGDTATPRGGDGGFGGGGGGGANDGVGSVYTPGGNGGFGGGAGGGYDNPRAGGTATGTPGRPGFGGGKTGTSFVGGGGAGFGGAIFVEDGGSVTLGGNGIVTGGNAIGGGSGARVGLGLGSGFYLKGTTGLRVAVGAGQTITIADTIASDAYADPGHVYSTNDADPAGDGIDGGVIQTGAGTLVLRGANTYAGGTTVNGGTVNAAADNNLGHASGGVTLNGGTLQWGAGFDTARSIALTQNNGALDTNGNNGTLNGVVSGAGGLVKSGTGTATLTNANTYQGDTLIQVGTLALKGTGGIAASSRVVADGAFDISGTTADASIKRLAGSGTVEFGSQTLVLTQANDTFSGQFTGSGGFVLVGGHQTLSGDSSAFTGQTNVRGGVLAVNGMLGGTMDVLGGRLQGTGTVGATTNHLGSIIAPGNSIGTLTVAGDYTSDGGGLEIEAKLGADNSPTDLLVITGDTILGTGATKVRVINVGGAGAETTEDGIRIVQVDGASAADAFVLNGPAIGAAYRYNLFHNGISDPADGDWYLRAAGLAPTVPVYENYPQVLLGMVALPTLEQRVGNRVRNAMNGNGDAGAAREAAIWTRIEAAHGHFEANASTANAAYDSDTALTQVGFDGQLYEGATGMLVGGLTAQYSRASADIFSSLGDGSNTTESHGIGANLTWYGETGFYVDGQAQVATLRSDMSAVGIGTIGDGIHGSGYALSLEAGRKIALDATWSLTPQAQLAYASVDFDAFTDPFGANVALRTGDSLKGRLGAAVNYYADAKGNHVYGIANLTYEFLDGTSVAVSGVNVAFEPQRFGGEIGLGGTFKWAGGKYALHGEALASTSFEGGYGFKGVVGFTAGL